MTLRIAATLAMTMGVWALAAYLHVIGRAPWSSPDARHLRAMKERVTSPATPKPVSIDSLAHLPRHLPLDRRAALERRGVVVEGAVQRMRRAADGDFHLDVRRDVPLDQEGFQPYLIAEITPGVRNSRPAWTYERLLARFRPPRGGETAWDNGPRRVRLTGWLLDDVPVPWPIESHEQRPPRRDYPQPLTQWEVHPVTRIEMWNDETRHYEDLR